MGVDMHAHIEYKVSRQIAPDAWEYFAEVHIPRDTDLFAKLSTEMGHDSGVPARGVPDDLSCTTQRAFDDEEGSASGASYLSLPELREACVRVDEENRLGIYTYSVHDRIEVRAVLCAMESLETDGALTRIVIWFTH